MMKRVSLLLACIAVSLVAPAALASEKPARVDIARVAVQVNISMREARLVAECEYPNARVVDVRLVEGSNNRPYYIVRMVEQGRRFDVHVSARNGEIINR